MDFQTVAVRARAAPRQLRQLGARHRGRSLLYVGAALPDGFDVPDGFDASRWVRRFQMGSMGDGGGETSTLTAAEHDDIDDWLCWASSGVW